jgi:hypothetical protein
MRRTVLFLALAGCPRPGEPEAPTPEGAVRLRFGWPAGLDLAVNASLERVRSGPSQQEEQSARAQWTMATEKEGSVLRVTTRDVTMTDGGSAVPTVVAAMAFGAHPAFLVDKQGNLGEIVGATELREQAAPLLADLDGAARARLEQRLSDEALGAVVADEWDVLVGRHLGQTLVPGPSEPIAARQEMPLAPGVVVGTVETRDWEAGVPCDGATCVKITWTQTLDEASATEVREAMKKGFGEAEVQDVSLMYAWELVTEPDTLVPHRLVAARRVSVRFVAGDVTANVEQADVLERIYTPR